MSKRRAVRKKGLTKSARTTTGYSDLGDSRRKMLSGLISR